MKQNYSPEFQKLIQSPAKLKDLLISCSFPGTFEAWEKRKSFIAEATHKNGTFLDIGCGNGFLLRCLQEWSEQQITPFGIDISSQFVTKAKHLFPHQSENFIVLDAGRINEIQLYLPTAFDYVYFSSNWINRSIDKEDANFIRRLQRHVKPDGRLIIAFYNEIRDKNLEYISKLESLGIKFSKIIENSLGTNLIAWSNID